MTAVNGWTLLFHPYLVEQATKVEAAADQARRRLGDEAASNANVKLFAALSKAVFETIPKDPSLPEYRQGNTMGDTYRHWRRIRFAGRFRLFFRFSSERRIIVFAWVNDEQSLRKVGSRTDPYRVFRSMLVRGNPPDDWAALQAQGSPALTAKATPSA